MCLQVPGIGQHETAQVSKAIVHVELNADRGKAWALLAHSTDPCYRLAFGVTFPYRPGKPITVYPQSDLNDAPYKANALLDWLKGDNDLVIASRPRRFVFIQKQQTEVPLILSKFIGEWYTDDTGHYFKQF